MKCKFVVLVATVLLLAISSNELAAYTWHVPATVSTIKHAVEDSAAYGDTVLVAPGIYDTTSGEVFPINMKNGVVLISESGASVTIVNANATGSVITCSNCDQSTEICGFTITGGSALNGGGISCGGLFFFRCDQESGYQFYTFSGRLFDTCFCGYADDDELSFDIFAGADGFGDWEYEFPDSLRVDSEGCA